MLQGRARQPDGGRALLQAVLPVAAEGGRHAVDARPAQHRPHHRQHRLAARGHRQEEEEARGRRQGRLLG